MAYLETVAIRNALAAWARTFSGGFTITPWADHVGTYDAPDLINALNDLLIITAARVILIIPGPERYEGSGPPGVPFLRRRITQLTMLIAVRDVDGVSVSVANSETIPEIEEVVYIKDAIIDALAAHGPLLPGADLYPIDGAPQEVFHADEPDRRLWRVWMTRLETAAGAVEYLNDTF